MPKRTDLRSILIIGSGPIRIGQGCGFDYSASQACRVLRREGLRVVLVTVQNHGFAVEADDYVSHVSLNDGTVEGLAAEDFATVQFHPEAAPGPLDGLPFFDQVAEACRSARIFAQS